MCICKNILYLCTPINNTQSTMKHQKYKRITQKLLSHTKGLQCLLCSVFLCSSMCSDPMSSPSYTPIDCVWDYGNVSFSHVSLSLPECVEIFGTEGYPPYQTLSEPYYCIEYELSKLLRTVLVLC